MFIINTLKSAVCGLMYNKLVSNNLWGGVRLDVHFYAKKIGYKCQEDRKCFVKLMIENVQFRSLFYHRIRCGKFIKLLLPPYKYLNISDSTKIVGGGLFLVSPMCTIINADSIGSNCMIRNNVTIGTNGNPLMEYLRPIIGDNVIIHCKVGIFGNITIGNNVTIESGTILTKSVPDNCIVVGNPAKIVKKEGHKVDIKL